MRCFSVKLHKTNNLSNAHLTTTAYIWSVPPPGGSSVYKVVQKTDPQFYFWDNFGNSAPILTILSLLQAEIYGA